MAIRHVQAARRTASLANRCTITKIAFFMDKQLAQHRTQEQGSRIAAAAHLNYEFAMYRRRTRCLCWICRGYGRTGIVAWEGWRLSPHSRGTATMAALPL